MNARSLLLTFSLLLTVGIAVAQTPPTTLWANNASTQWYDGQNTLFTLSTAEDLAGLSVLVAGGNAFTDKTILIGSNIDLAAHLWTPIGVDLNAPFSGTMDGNGFAISNLFIVMPGEGFIGLFGRCTSATLSNIILQEVYIRTNDTAGSLAGSFATNSTMDNCHANGVDMVATQYNIGGLVGELVDDSHMLRCSSHGDVTGVNQVGGLLGTPFNLTSVIECYSTGTVDAQYLAGGLIGFSTFAFQPNRENTINNCYSRAAVTVVNGRAGGLVGGTDAQLIILNSYSTGTATGAEFAGGLVGAVGSVSTTNNYWDVETSAHTDAVGGFTNAPQAVDITGRTTAEMKTEATVTLLNQNQPAMPWTIIPTLNDGYPVLASQVVAVPELHGAAATISVYPTLFTDNITVTSTEKLTSYSLLDVSGRTIQNGTLNGANATITTPQLPAGTYVLLINTRAGSVSKKVVKE